MAFGVNETGGVEYWLVVVQAVSAAVSALVAFFLLRMTAAERGEDRRDRERDRTHDQLRRLVEGVHAVRDVVADPQADETDLAVARAQLATAVALRPIELSACEAVLAEDMLKPPYAMASREQWRRVEAALAELRSYALRLASS